MRYIFFTILGLVFLVSYQNNAFSQIKGNPSEGAALYNNCVPCHGLNGEGIAHMQPELFVDYVEKAKLATFENPQLKKMQKIFLTLSKQQIDDLAAYVSKM